MTRKIRIALFLIAGLFLAALITRNGTIALITIPFLIYICIDILDFPGDIRLEAKRELSTFRCNEFSPISMQLLVENHGSPISRICLLEPNYPGMQIMSGSKELSFSLSEKDNIDMQYSFTLPRGSYGWQRITLVVSDTFGLFEKTIHIEAGTRVNVLPEPMVLRQFKYHPNPNIRTIGTNLSRLPGTGIDFWGVREYHPGDPLSSIHWRKKAQSPRSLFSKSFEREEMADIGLLLDGRMQTNNFSGLENLFEYSIKAMSTLARHFIAKGNRVSMLVLNDRLIRVFPGYGKHQLIRILDELAGCTTGDKVTLGILKHLPVRLFPSRSVIVFVSPLDPGDYQTIKRLHIEGYQLLIISPNPVQKCSRDIIDNTDEAFALRATIIERKLMFRRISRLGVHIVDWDISQPLNGILQSIHFARM